jgi:hypothetical protein
MRLSTENRRQTLSAAGEYVRSMAGTARRGCGYSAGGSWQKTRVCIVLKHHFRRPVMRVVQI